MYELTTGDLSWRCGGSEFSKCSHRTSQVRGNLITGQREPRHTEGPSWDTIQGTEGWQNQQDMDGSSHRSTWEHGPLACPLTAGDPGKLQHQVTHCNMTVRTHITRDVAEGNYAKYRDAAHRSLITGESPSRAELPKQG